MQRRGRRQVGLRVVAVLSAVAASATVRAESSVDTRVLAAEPGSTLLSRIGADVEVAHVTRERITSQSVDLRRLGDRLHGRVGAEQVDLVLQPGHIGGDIGGRPISLDVRQRAPRALEVAGQFGNRVVAIEITPRGVAGELGPCVYRTGYRDGAYRGEVSCGGQPTTVELRFPPVFVARSDVELAAILTAILTR